ncbi:hypothetical protein [Roseivirga misakiensis]|uniref:DUF4890 domain-containing protein n=1 Tax=Roseivirga misakiensis TaxID=1563681 RepID=A0A1E5T6C3_9BACT|nr:hypothetical protein [Roseivirga misakiensis]OEK06913.1 hypothetical protein BFP71_04460 [Roseivirga misakiensis]
MRSFIKLFFIAAAVFSSSQLLAQDKNKTLLQTERMAKALELTDKQKAALDKELKAAKEERQVAMEKAKAIREEMRRDAFVAREAREAKLKDILTEEQWAKYESAKKRGRGAMLNRAKRGQDSRQGGRFQRRGQIREDGRRPMRDTLRRRVVKRRVEMLKEKKETEEKENGGGN